MSRRPDSGVPDLVLERYRLRELPPDEMQALERRLDAEPELAERLRALERSDEEIRRRYPPAWLAEQIRARQKATSKPVRPERGWLIRWPVPVALAAAATLALALAPRLVSPPRLETSPGPEATPAVDSGDRVKGLRPSLVLFRRTDSGGETLDDGSLARPGDIVRIGYRSAGRAFGAILSVDGRGLVTVHLPSRGSEAVRLQAGETVLLDRAFELDDAPRFERFYLVTADRAFEIEPVVEAARRSVATARPEALPLTEPFEQATFLLRKGGRP